jgi:hypothetical protein
MKLAKRAGLSSPDNIGRSTHQYAMGRLGDTGNYVWGNCRFITVEQNLKERKKNGGNVSISETQQGRTANTHASVARVAAQNRGRTAETHDSVARSAEKRSASFIVTSPDGKRYKGRNVSAFCRAHGLHQGRLSRVLSGARNHYSGWTGYYTD